MKLIPRLGLCALLLLGATVVCLSFVPATAWRQPAAAPKPPELAAALPATASAPGPQHSGPADDETESLMQERRFIEEMQQRFAAHLHRPHAQLRILEQLISYLRSQHPQDWELRIRALIAAMFPQQADDLHARFLQLAGYQDWLRQERAGLLRMPKAQRRAALWAERYRSFGADADLIWAAEKRSQALEDALELADPDLSTDARLQHFVSAIDHIYGEQAGALLARHKTELVHNFLSQGPVQSELQGMETADRQRTLNAVRSQLGIDEAALQRWQTLDHLRDDAWDRGQQYMEERAELLATLPAELAQARIDSLREELFGTQANTLKAEENSGFLRYARARRYGRE